MNDTQFVRHLKILASVCAAAPKLLGRAAWETAKACYDLGQTVSAFDQAAAEAERAYRRKPA